MKPNLDTEELQKKRANMEKVRTFSKNLTALNREIIARQPQAQPTASVATSKVDRAKDYSKSVPRPRPRRVLTEMSVESKVPNKEMDQLSLLEAEHQDRRRQAAAIRAELGL